MAGSSIQTWCFYIIYTTRVGYSTQTYSTGIHVRPDLQPTLAESDTSGGEESEDEWWPPGNLSSRDGLQIGRVGGGDVDTDSDEDRVYSELVDGPGIASGRTIRRPKWAS